MNTRKIVFWLCFTLSLSTSMAQKDYPCEIELSKKALKLYQQAKTAQNKGDRNKATALYKEIIAEQEDWAEPYYSLGLQAIRQLERGEGNSEAITLRAIDYFEKTIELCPDFKLEAYLHLGKLNFNIGKYDKTIQYLEKYIEDPDRIPSRLHEEADYFLTFAIEYEKIYGNPVAYDPKPIPGISTKDDEYLARISPDEELMFFTRRQITSKNVYGQQKTSIDEIFSVSQRQSDGSFSVGEPMPTPPFNMTTNEGSPTITLDNAYMVLTRCANVPVEGSGATYYNCDLYYTEYINGEWTTIKNLGPAINQPDSWEAQASISPDGKILFFASNRPGGHGDGDIDIYYSLRDANGNWQKAVNAGAVINTEGNEKAPFLHSDGRTLYFSSNGLKGLGGYDIYYSRLSDKGTWQKPQNIGHPINSEADEVGFFVNTSGDKAFFGTNTITGNFDICQFDLYEEARPQKVLLIKGTINNLETNDDGSTAKVELKNISTKQITEIRVNQENGKYAAIVNDINGNYLITVKQNNYNYEARYIDAFAILSEGQPILNDVDFTMKEIEQGNAYKINDIYFATNSWELTNTSEIVLDVLIDFLNDNPNIHIEIQGHTDNIGKYEDNLTLSNNRAKAVYDYLIENFIDSNRLSFKGYADKNPIADNKTEEGRALNRRTVFVITKQ